MASRSSCVRRFRRIETFSAAFRDPHSNTANGITGMSLMVPLSSSAVYPQVFAGSADRREYGFGCLCASRTAAASGPGIGCSGSFWLAPALDLPGSVCQPVRFRNIPAGGGLDLFRCGRGRRTIPSLVRQARSETEGWARRALAYGIAVWGSLPFSLLGCFSQLCLL